MLTELNSTLQSGRLASLDARRIRCRSSIRGDKRKVDLPGAIIGKSLALDLGAAGGRPDNRDLAREPRPARRAAPRLRRFVVTRILLLRDVRVRFGADFRRSAKTGRALLADDPQLESGLEVAVARICSTRPRLRRQIAAIAGPGFTVKDWTQRERAAVLGFASWRNSPTSGAAVDRAGGGLQYRRDAGDGGDGAAQGNRDPARDGRAGRLDRRDLPDARGRRSGSVGTALGVPAPASSTSWVIGKYHLIHLPADLFMVSAVPVRLYRGELHRGGAARRCCCAWWRRSIRRCKARSLSPVEVIRYE